MIAVAFGLPAVIRKVLTSAHVFPIVPIQIMDACIRSVSQLSPGRPHFVSPKPGIIPDIPTSTWLPALGMTLPHSWIEQEAVTEKAAKRDDADVHTALWDRQITLIIPHISNALPIFRSILMRLGRLRLAREFSSYLTKEYGLSWRRRLRCQWGQRPLKRQKGGIKDDNSASNDLTKDFVVGTGLLEQWAENTGGNGQKVRPSSSGVGQTEFSERLPGMGWHLIFLVNFQLIRKRLALRRHLCLS